jgi:integrase
MLIDDYTVNERRSTDRAKLAVRHLAGFFSRWRAIDITPDQFNAYVRTRLEEKPPARPATILTERAALTRMFTLAYRSGKVAMRPSFPPIRVRNARRGFFEDEDLIRVLSHLPDDSRAVVQFLHLTGWRRGEALSLQWRQVDLKAGVVRLEPGTTKNDDGRTFPFTASPELREVLLHQREVTSALERERGQIIPWVFHRRGRRWRDIRYAWKRACIAAGCPGMLVHDLRRTAVREMERAGVPRPVAMKLSGHKTEEIYRRYAIVSEADLSEGVSRRTTFRERTRTVQGQLAQFGTSPAKEPQA